MKFEFVKFRLEEVIYLVVYLKVISEIVYSCDKIKGILILESCDIFFF